MVTIFAKSSQEIINVKDFITNVMHQRRLHRNSFLQSRAAAILALVCATACWGANLTYSRTALSAFTSLQLASYRWVPAVLIFGVLALVLEKRRPRIHHGEWGRLILCGIIGGLGYSLLLFLALQHLSAAQAGIFSAFNPLMISLAAFALYRTPIFAKAWAGLAIAMLGIILIFALPAEADLMSRDSLVIGMIFIFLALIAWTIFTLVSSKLTTPPLTSALVQGVTALSTSAILLSTRQELVLPELQLSHIVSYLFVSIFATTIAFLLWLFGSRITGAGIAGNFINLVPVFAVSVAAMNGETIAPIEILGSGVVIFGTVLASSPQGRAWPRRKNDKGPPEPRFN